MRIGIILIFSLILLNGCIPTSPQRDAADNFIVNFAESVEEPQELYLFGSGGRVTQTVDKFSFCFFSLKTMTVDEARHYVVTNVEELLNRIHIDPCLAPYLKQVPFDIKNVEFSILFTKTMRSEDCLDTSLVSYVFITEGFVFYDRYDPFRNRFVNLHSETYQKAQGIVEHQRNLESISWVN